jgi:uncharacterized repeat protein (TIGR04076 family)
MKGKKIIAELIDPGQCRYYSRGQKFELTGGFKPQGFCDSGYSVVSKASKMLLKDNKLSGGVNDRILAQCPAHGAVWEIRMEEAEETKNAVEEISRILGKP